MMQSRLTPAQFVQPIVVDPEMVGHLMDHRDHDLMGHLSLGLTHGTDGMAEHGDAIGKHQIAVGESPLGQRCSLVAAQKAPPHRTVIDDHRHVVHELGKLIGNGVEGVHNQGLKPFGGDIHGPNGSHRPVGWSPPKPVRGYR